jgi:regulator of nonsense transcripts 1
MSVSLPTAVVLPPTVTSPGGAAAGLDQTLFERLQRAGLRTRLLDTQYRMHPSLAAFPSARFYDSALKSGTDPGSLQPPAGFPWPVAGFPAAFVETDTRRYAETAAEGGEAGAVIDSAAVSRSNRAEAVLALRAAAALRGCFRLRRKGRRGLQILAWGRG